MNFKLIESLMHPLELELNDIPNRWLILALLNTNEQSTDAIFERMQVILKKPVNNGNVFCVLNTLERSGVVRVRYIASVKARDKRERAVWQLTPVGLIYQECELFKDYQLIMLDTLKDAQYNNEKLWLKDEMFFYGLTSYILKDDSLEPGVNIHDVINSKTLKVHRTEGTVESIHKFCRKHGIPECV